MAELTKKLHFLKSGTEQTAKAYSTTAEAGSSYITNKIDGMACYIPIGATTDAMATKGRVIKGGTTYAIKSQAKPPYAKVKYTTSGTYTFTVPAGVTTLRCEIAGAGGGGGGGGTWTSGGGGGGSGYKEFGKLITVEPNSTITVVVGAGGSGGAYSKNGSAGGNSKVANFSSAGGRGGTGGRAGAGGAGGNAGSAGSSSSGGAGGAGGTIGVNDGAGGAGGAGGKGNASLSKGTDGSAGWVVIEYGGDI